MAPKAIDQTTEAKYGRRFEEGYDINDPEYYKWMRYNYPVEAETWIKSAIRKEDANDVEKPVSSTGNTEQTPESETTEKSCENPGPLQPKSGEHPGPTKPLEQLKHISRFLVQVIQVPKEKDKVTPKLISGGRALTSMECTKFLEEKEAQKRKG